MTLLRVCLVVMLAAAPGGVEERQLFINADGDRATGYGREGADFLVDVDGAFRETISDGLIGAGGWGRDVECHVEVYKDGAIVAWFSDVACTAFECCPGADLDGDGDVDLRDFALMQIALAGPD